MILPTPDEILNQFRDAQLSLAEKFARMKTFIDMQIAEADVLIGRQLDEIIHYPDFRALEAAWRGLYYLVNETCPNRHLKIKVLTTSKRELLKDFERQLELAQTSLYKRIYDDVYNTFGEDPYGLLIGDYEFSNHPQDIALLERMAMIAISVNSPFISGAHPQLFGEETFSEVCERHDPTAIFDQSASLKWNWFRESEGSSYVGLCLPHILLREPYAQISDTSFSFHETVQPEMLLWGNAAYAFGACVAKAYRESGWCGMMSGPGSDGEVEGLPEYEINNFKQQVDTLIDAEKEKILSDLGFLPLMQNFGSHKTAFFSAQSCAKARRYDNEHANADARLRIGLPYVLAVSRFAHYLKAMARDRSKPFENGWQCREELNKWLRQYFHSIGEIGDDLRARFPLSDCLIDIAKSQERPGEFRGIAFLRPEYQLAPLSVSMRTAFELPKVIGEDKLK